LRLSARRYMNILYQPFLPTIYNSHLLDLLNRLQRMRLHQSETEVDTRALIKPQNHPFSKCLPVTVKDRTSQKKYYHDLVGNHTTPAAYICATRMQMQQGSNRRQIVIAPWRLRLIHTKPYSVDWLHSSVSQYMSCWRPHLENTELQTALRYARAHLRSHSSAYQ